MNASRIREIAWRWLSAIVDAMKNLFGNSGMPTEPPYLVVEDPKVFGIKSVPRRKAETATLADVLGRVEEAFENIELPVGNHDDAGRDLRIGLRRMGPWIPFGPVFEDGSREFVAKDYLGSWPSLFFIGRSEMTPEKLRDGVDSDGEALGMAKFIYGQRLRKAPWDVEQLPGEIYSMGIAFRYRGRLDWISIFVAVDPLNGHVRVCRNLCLEHVTVDKSRKGRCSYARRVWDSRAAQNTAWGDNKVERERVAANLFINAFEWWQRRKERWAVSVRKNGRRVTWSVEQEQTKEFFADRKVTARTPTGQKRRILHYVQSHTRQSASGIVRVAEHIRGLREFEWRGFDCAITAPKFHSYSLEKFDVPAMDMEIREPKEKMIGPASLGRLLSDLEDSRNVRRAA